MSKDAKNRKIARQEKIMDEIKEFTESLLSSKKAKAVFFVAITKHGALTAINTPKDGATLSTLRRLEFEVEELHEVLKDEIKDAKKPENEDELKVEELKNKLMKAAKKEGIVDENGKPTKKALAALLTKVLLADERPNAHEVLNDMCGSPLSKNEIEWLKYNDNEEDDEDEDED